MKTLLLSIMLLPIICDGKENHNKEKIKKAKDHIVKACSKLPSVKDAIKRVEQEATKHVSPPIWTTMGLALKGIQERELSTKNLLRVSHDDVVYITELSQNFDTGEGKATFKISWNFP